MKSFIDKIVEILHLIKALKDDFLDTCKITYIDTTLKSNEFFVSVGGSLITKWGDSSEKQLMTQIQLIEQTKKLDEYLKMIEHKMPIEKFEDIKKAQNKISNWIHKKGDPPGLSNETSKTRFDKELKTIEDFLSQLRGKKNEIIIVPDTNAIIQYPDPKSYFKVSKNSKFTFLILPTVLSELDNHKNFHKNPDFQKKVTSVIQRLKGYIKQGDIQTGVIIENKQISVKMIETEPKFDFLPDWLERENKDDRIIASILSFQINNFNSFIYLVTGDLNMINKAKLAGINYFDNDEME